MSKLALSLYYKSPGPRSTEIYKIVNIKKFLQNVHGLFDSKCECILTLNHLFVSCMRLNKKSVGVSAPVLGRSVRQRVATIDEIKLFYIRLWP